MSVDREMDIREKEYAYFLASMPGMGSRRIHRMLELCGSARAVYEASEAEWCQVITTGHYAKLQEARAGWDLTGNYQRMLEQGIGFVLREEASYPTRLKEIPDAPFGLFYRGRLPAEEIVSVAIIGARACSEYGRYVAKELGRELGKMGVQVISGMARGIDGIAQLSALEAGGRSFGILGSGVDVCYPKENQRIYDRLLCQGGVLSEYVPGTLARAQNFPPRNRIVSGLCDAVVVVEAREQSGTLITVDMALEQGREVYVVPGRLTDALSTGCNRLLKQGAEILWSIPEFLQELEQLHNRGCNEERGKTLPFYKRDGQAPKAQAGAVQMTLPLVEPRLLLFYEALDFYPKSLEQLRSHIKEPCTLQALQTGMMELCLANHAVQVSPGYFCKKGGSYE